MLQHGFHGWIILLKTSLIGCSTTLFTVGLLTTCNRLCIFKPVLPQKYMHFVDEMFKSCTADIQK